MGSLSYLNRYFGRYKVRLSLGILFIGLSNFFGVYWTPVFRDAINYAVEARSKALDSNEVLWQLFWFTAIIIGAALLSGFFMFLMRQTIIVMSRLIEYDLKNDIYSHYQKLDLGFYKRNNTGDLMNRISEDVSRVRMYIGPAIMYLVNTTVTVITVLVFMINVDLSYTIYVLLPLPFLAYLIYRVSEIINRKSTLVQQQLSTLSTHAQESFSGIRVVKAFSLEEANNDRFKKKAESYKDLSLSLAKTEALFQPSMILLIGMSTIITVFVGGIESINGNISTANITEFIIYVNKLIWPVASLGWVTSLVQRAAASQQRINEFLNTQPAILTNTHEEINIKGDIEFRNVSFKYEDSGIQALKHVSFRVNAGESLAIIGRTGSGKSTLANLVCRLYDPDSGDIFVDGKNLKEINLNSLRTQTGYVPQEVFLFSDTIANNIAFTSGKQKPSREEIEEAARIAAIYDNIMEFPNGFETLIGERGVTLSGGQKQRISIARSVIKSPRILVFDDCLSAVDTETEEEILGKLRSLMKGKTTIIISHRVSSVKDASHIIFLDHGSIIEEGSHEMLMLRKGAYFRLYEQQQLEKEKT